MRSPEYLLAALVLIVSCANTLHKAPSVKRFTSPMPYKSIETIDCALDEGSWAQDNPQLCRLFLMHHHLADAIDTIAMDPDLPPTDILIVGDHFPPFFDRVDRSRFAPGVVPWVLLRRRDEDSEQP